MHCPQWNQLPPPPLDRRKSKNVDDEDADADEDDDDDDEGDEDCPAEAVEGEGFGASPEVLSLPGRARLVAAPAELRPFEKVSSVVSPLFAMLRGRADVPEDEA